MNSGKLLEILKKRLPSEHFDWDLDLKFDKVRLEHKLLKKGMDISLPEIISRYNMKKDAAIDEIVYTIDETFKAMEREQKDGFQGEIKIYPVIRSTSFPEETSNGHRFIMKDHTVETRIYYALDLGTTYRLIDNSMLEAMELTETELMESALFRVRSLPTSMKKDEVDGNIYYFVNNNDGYDASSNIEHSIFKRDGCEN